MRQGRWLVLQSTLGSRDHPKCCLAFEELDVVSVWVLKRDETCDSGISQLYEGRLDRPTCETFDLMVPVIDSEGNVSC